MFHVLILNTFLSYSFFVCVRRLSFSKAVSSCAHCSWSGVSPGLYRFIFCNNIPWWWTPPKPETKHPEQQSFKFYLQRKKCYCPFFCQVKHTVLSLPSNYFWPIDYFCSIPVKTGLNLILQKTSYFSASSPRNIFKHLEILII